MMKSDTNITNQMEVQLVRNNILNKLFLTVLFCVIFLTQVNATSIYNFNVTFDGVTYDLNNNTSTWTYTVTGNGQPPALSHWDLELCDNHTVIWSNYAYSVGVDPTTGIDGIKWDIPIQPNESKTFIFTLNGIYSETEVTAAVKGGNDFGTGNVIGPDCDYYEVCSGEIGDYVFVDMTNDCNGGQDGSLPIVGATVELTFGSTTLTATTDETGKYYFTELCAGDYVVTIVDVPAQYSEYTLSTNGSYNVTLAENDSKYYDADFGYCPPVEECLGEIGNYVFVDMTDDCNGGQTGSTPIAGAVVQLVFGSETLTTTTDEFGYYYFTELCEGDYVVSIVSVPSEYSEYTLSTPSSFNVTLNENDSKFFDADFGYCPPDDGCEGEGVIGDKVWFDEDCDGIQDISENGLAGITVYLKDAGGNILYTTTTNSDGFYKFMELCAGTYYVFVDESTLPTGYTPTATYVNTVPNSYKHDSNENGEEVILEFNDSKNHTIDFGYCGPNDDPEVDIEIEKSASSNNVEDGETFTYTITVKNNGPDDATGVEVTDVLPDGVEFVSYSATQGTFDNVSGIWNVGNLANGVSKTLTITVQVDVEESNNATFNLGAASGYNLFVHKDVNQPSSDTEGKVAVGRNAYFANYSVGDKLPANSGDVLIVGNHLEYVSGAVYNGNVVYGNSTNLDEEYYAVSITGGSLIQGTPIDFSAAFADLRALSNTLFGYATNGTTTMQWGGLKLEGTDPYLNVFKVDGADLSSANNFQIDVPNGSVVLVNIFGNDISWTGGLTVNGTSIGNVLYNFKGTENLTIQGIDVRGSILAPKAHVNFVAGVQNGQMICKSLEGMGQFNNTQFIGNIPTQTEITNVAVVSSVNEFDTNLDNDMDDAVVTVNGQDSGNGGGGNGGGSGSGNWEYIGSFLEGQIVWSLAYTDDGCILVGTWGGAIYKSDTEGKNFVRINENMHVGFIWSLLVHNGYYYAGTEQGVFRFDGTTWTLVGLNGMDVRSLVAVEGKIYAGVWTGGVYVSEDDGMNWTNLQSDMLNWAAVHDITVTFDLDFNIELFVATLGNGVCYSGDGGASWVELNIGYNFVWSIASTSNGTLFAGTYGGGLYTSVDGGMNWSHVTEVTANYIYDITVDVNNNVYISTLLGGIYVSVDGGSSFNNAGMGGLGTSSVLAFGSSEASNVYVGTSDGKIYRKTDNNGVTSVEDEDLPREFKLDQNYPNPFNPSTTIQFAVPKAGEYKVVVYNILGQQVAELLNTQLQPGVHKVDFSANQLASGIYIYQLIGQDVNFSKKMILIK